ncbi:uncharacterized protein LOC126810237 isoform X1 [Patella vulgata]|uniref:uncharacterized protein LOC126810237 isoform X1 n=1 Tax=Patella vulgata TaxID=6465 RepID=UPI0021800995|nr:uncharacterized protein LOC126810237 isoform X1 [Patella vulgata]
MVYKLKDYTNLLVYCLVSYSVTLVCCELIINYRCYSPPDSPCSSHTLACSSDSKIIIDERNYKISYGRKDANTSCESSVKQCFNNLCCMKNSTDLLTLVSQEYRLQVYRNCSNQQSCILDPPYSPDGGYHYIQYPIFCQPKNTIVSMMETETVSNLFEMGLYFSGEKTPTLGLSCSCNISSPAKVGIVVWFINLRGESCPKIQLVSEQPVSLNCSSGGVFIPYGGIDIPFVGTHKSIELDHLTSSPDDVYFILFHTSIDQNITASCSCYLPVKPLVHIKPSTDPYKVIEGGQLMLTCVVDESNPVVPADGFTWIKNGIEIKGHNTSIYIIEQLEMADNGTYTCTGNNGVDTGIDPILVDILYGPIVIVSTDTVTVAVGGELRITCTVQSNPQPFSLKWYKPDGTSSQGRELVISNFQKNDTGVYSCEAISTLVLTNGSSITRSDNKPTIVKLEPEAWGVSGTVIGLSVALSLMTVTAILAGVAVLYLRRKTKRKDSETDMYLPPVIGPQVIGPPQINPQMARNPEEDYVNDTGKGVFLRQINPQMTRNPEEDYVNNEEMYEDLDRDTRLEPHQSVYQGFPKYINQRTKSSNQTYDGSRRSTNEDSIYVNDSMIR